MERTESDGARPRKRGRRRGHSPHPYVVLIAPRNGHAWQARYLNPDLAPREPEPKPNGAGESTGKRRQRKARRERGRWVSVSLGPTGLDRRTEEQRREWAISKSRTITGRLAAIESGDPVANGRPLADVIADFLKAKREEGKPVSARDAERRLKPLTAWVSQQPEIKTTADLTAAHAARFGVYLGAMRRKRPAKNSADGERVGKGAMVLTDEPLSQAGKNGYLTVARMFFNWARRMHYLRIHRDDISDAFKVVVGDGAKRVILKEPDTIRRILRAAMRRDEARGESVAGPIALILLMTGARVGEVRGLDWNEITLDGDGAIEFPAFRTKTNRSREVTFSVCPTIKALFAALRLRAGSPSVGPVFGGVNLRAIGRDLIANYGAPRFEWKHCRSTSASYLACAAGCRYTLFMVADRLGHETRVCEKHYAKKVSVPAKARTLEAAMRVEAEAQAIVARASGRGGARVRRDGSRPSTASARRAS